MASPAARLAGFLILLAVLFAGARAAGALAGPVTVTHPQPGQGGTMQMGNGSGPARPWLAGTGLAGTGLAGTGLAGTGP